MLFKGAEKSELIIMFLDRILRNKDFNVPVIIYADNGPSGVSYLARAFYERKHLYFLTGRPKEPNGYPIEKFCKFLGVKRLVGMAKGGLKF